MLYYRHVGRHVCIISEVLVGKREQIRDYILEEIKLGRLCYGSQLYSRAVFMEKFACARATVDIVISDLIGSGVLVSEKGRGTFVADKNLRIQEENVAIVAPGLDNPHSMPKEIANGFMEGIGPKASVKYYTYNELKHPSSWESCKAQRGIVFIQPDTQHASLLYDARMRKIPHIVLYRDPSESPFVSIDNRSGVSALVTTLANRGCRRIAYLGLRQDRYNFPEQRYTGYLEGLLSNGLSMNKSHIGLVAHGMEASFINNLFQNAPFRPEALIVGEIPLGIVIKELNTLGLVAGKDIYLANFDEIPPNTYSFKVLSLKSVTHDVGINGATLFRKIIKNGERLAQAQLYITPTVVEQ